MERSIRKSHCLESSSHRDDPIAISLPFKSSRKFPVGRRRLLGTSTQLPEIDTSTRDGLCDETVNNDGGGDGDDLERSSRTHSYQEILSGKALQEGEVPPALLRNADPEQGAPDPPVAIAEPLESLTTSLADSSEEGAVVYGPTGEQVCFAVSRRLSNPTTSSSSDPSEQQDSSKSIRGRRALCVAVAMAIILVTTVTLAVLLPARRAPGGMLSERSASPTVAPTSAGAAEIPVMYEHLTTILYGAFPEEACHTYAISGVSGNLNASKKYEVDARTWMECNSTGRTALAQEETFNYVDGRPKLFIAVDDRWSVFQDYDPEVGTCRVTVPGSASPCYCAECTTADGDFGLRAPCLQHGECAAITLLVNPTAA